MLKLKDAIVWGHILERIRGYLDQIDTLYLGLFINSLSYQDKKKGNEEKTKFLVGLKSQVEKINLQVKHFNAIRKFAFGNESKLEKLPQAHFSTMRRIVERHKGDYSSEKGKNAVSFAEEWLGETDSASSLARKHTALQLRNTFLPLRVAMGRFVESLSKLEEPFHVYLRNKKQFRPVVGREIEKSISCFTMNLKGEAVFIIGRLLENLCSEMLQTLKRNGEFKLMKIQVENIDFEQKLNLLHYKLKKLTPGQFSKAMSLKWDRNTFVHEIGQLNTLWKDAEAIITTGMNLIYFLERKVVIIKKLRK